METALEKRIEKAWEECKEWITTFDGSPTIALLVNVPNEAILPAVTQLSQQGENFRITSIAGSQPQFIPLADFPAHLALLEGDKLADLSVNYAVRSEAFDLDLRLILHPIKPGQAAVEIVWWNDQVFSEETEGLPQFKELIRFFLDLQALFSGGGLFLSPEGGQDPTVNSDAWVEI